jgi:large subunit ribosomal protein L25
MIKLFEKNLWSQESRNYEMSKSIQLNERTSILKSQMKLGRQQGLIPAVLYGIGKETISVEVNEKEMLNVLKKNPRAILQAATSQAGAVPVVIQSVQRDMMTGKLMHIDFHHVNMSESMDSKVTIHFAGEAAGVKAGGVLQIEMYEVDVRCMPDQLPSSMEVDISGLAIGDQLLVSDLIFQDGVTVLSDAQAVMIQIKNVQEEEEVAAEAVETPASK